MARQRHLNRAPIREALIDIQFGPPVSMEAVGRPEAKFKSDLKAVTDIWQASIGFQFQGGDGATAKKNIVGKRYDFSDGAHVLQTRTTGFTFSRLPPYENWAQIRGKALECWRCFADGLGSARVSRIAVRYINALPLPIPIPDFGDFLTAAPKVPPALPQEISGFMHQTVMHDREVGSSAIVTQALETPQGGGHGSQGITLLFDIDVFQEVDMALKEDEELWSRLDQMRGFKNRIFFEYLTERTVGLFE